MLRKVLLGLGVAVLLFVVVVATRPGAFRIERSTSISAPPAVVYNLVEDFHAWGAWSPWEKLDPSMKRSFEGSPRGVGAIYGWAGNDKAGEGKMTIERAEAPNLVGIKLQFLKPFEATNAVTFTFTPAGADTKVVWVMEGTNNFVGKAFSMFMDMDTMVGDDFAKGLAAMKAAAEAKAKEAAAAKAAPAVNTANGDGGAN